MIFLVPLELKFCSIQCKTVSNEHAENEVWKVFVIESRYHGKDHDISCLAHDNMLG